MQAFLFLVSKYLFIALMLFYTWECFSALRCNNPIKLAGIFQRQNGIIFLFYILGMVMLYFNLEDVDQINIIILGGAQLCYLIIVLGVFPVLYPNINKSILSNMCMLLSIGFLVQASFDFKGSITQFTIVVIVTLLSLVVPFIVQHDAFLEKLTILYCIVGLGLLAWVLFHGITSRGAQLYMETSFFSFQPSEFVKIIFVFFIAALLRKSADFKHVVISGVFAASFIGILVFSKDLGTALIFFMIYLFMLYVATKKSIYVFLGIIAMSGASVIAYFIFSHVRERVTLWLDPWQEILKHDHASQVVRALFSIADGGWFGIGLCKKGQAESVQMVKMDEVFAFIAEKFGGIFSMLLILVFLSCFIAFLATAMKQVSMFNRLICIGLGVQFAVQVILTIGGSLKMIPLTGVTLPFISYGGSSILSSLIVFSIIQGLAIVGVYNEDSISIRGRSDIADDEQTRSTIEHTQELPKL